NSQHVSGNNAPQNQALSVNSDHSILLVEYRHIPHVCLDAKSAISDSALSPKPNPQGATAHVGAAREARRRMKFSALRQLQPRALDNRCQDVRDLRWLLPFPFWFEHARAKGFVRSRLCVPYHDNSAT